MKSPQIIAYLMVKAKALPLRALIRQRRPLLSLLFDIALEVLTRAIRQEKERKVIKIAKKKMNLCSQMVWS